MLQLLAVLLPSIGVVALLLLVRLLSRSIRLAPFPLRLPLLSVLAWTLVRLLPVALLPDGYRPWVELIDELMISYAVVRILLWAGIEVPASLGAWAQPPPVLLQLVMLSSGSVITVVVFKELARFDLLGLVTTSAVLTAVLGLAAQEPLKDLFAGLELQLDDQLKLGDFIRVNENTEGVIVSIDWRDTCLRDVSGAMVMVPNAVITSVVLRSYGAFGSMGNRFSIGLEYDLPPAQARRLLLGIVQSHPRSLSEPPAAVRVKAFGESAIEYDILVFQKPGNLGDLLDLRSDLLEQIWYAMEREGHSVPYPVRELRRKPPAPDAYKPISHSAADRIRVLRLNPIFAGLTEQEFASLAANTRSLRFAPGETVVVEGEEGGAMYQVLHGQVEVLKQQANAPALQVACLSPGDIFGEMSMLSGSLRSATVRSLEECVLLEVSREQLGPLLKENPALMDGLAHLVSKRRGQLEGLERETVKIQENQLLKRMQQLFDSLIH
jgi:small-conductance mechanosensitive channel/CRP-like cAMP-binding protein